MDILATLAEALVMSLVIIGSFALDLLLLVWIVLCLFILAVLLRWAAGVAWYAGVAAYHRKFRRSPIGEAAIRKRMIEQEFCHFCGASVPHREGEGRCERCEWVMK